MFELLEHPSMFAPPKWQSKSIVLPEAPEEENTVWFRSLPEVADWLFANPMFEGELGYRAQEIYEADGRTRIYHEMWTGDDWRAYQVKNGAGYTSFTFADLPFKTAANTPGLTLQGGILASDSAAMTSHSGGVMSHNVLFSLGNIPMESRAALRNRAWMLVGFIPKSSWAKTCFGSRTEREDMVPILNKRLFHASMEVIVSTMKGQKMRMAQDADGWWRLVYTVIMAYLADLEEQWLILCLSKNRCPHCLAGYHDLDKPGKCAARTASSILETIQRIQGTLPPNYSAYQFVKAAQKEGLCGVERPFWIDLEAELGVDLCHILCSDLLHGCHKFWNDHIVKWTTNVIGKAELDARIRSQPHQSGFRSFPTGISKISQWTCRQTRDLQKTFLPAIIGAPSQTPSLSNRMVRANRAALDYIQIAQYPCHTDRTLGELTGSIQKWQDEKWVFVENGGRKGDDSGEVINHFRIPKNHSPEHFVEHIKARGSLVGQSTEQMERYHPLVSKNGYHLTNHKSHEVQLLHWLNRHERIASFFHYLRWWIEDPDLSEKQLMDEGAGIDDGSGEEVRESESLLAVNHIAEDSENEHQGLEGKRLAKTPHRKNMTLAQIAADHAIPGLEYALGEYLRSLDPGVTSWPGGFELFDVWYDLRVEIPVVNDFYGVEWRRIRARPPHALAKASGSHFDPVLIHDTDDAEVVGLKG